MIVLGRIVLGMIHYNGIYIGCRTTLPDCLGMSLSSTLLGVFGHTRLIIFLSSVSLAFMLPRSLMFSEVLTSANSVVLNVTVPSSFSGMFILIRRFKQKERGR